MRTVSFVMTCVATLAVGTVLIAAGAAPGPVSPAVTARDPGPRPGTTTVAAVAGLTPAEWNLFQSGRQAFSEVDSVPAGLGPRMNLDSCAGCHAQPVVGGTSPAVNPQVGFATAGADRVPSFIALNGPVRVARFVRNADGSPDGGVHDLFTITGRPGASGCTLAQPDFEREIANRNVIYRIPTPTFGAGLIEQIPDAVILANQARNADAKRAMGIGGHPNFHVGGRTTTGQSNRNGNDGTIARFGWKAQNKSLLLFAGEAYNVEQGVSNELFPTERDETAACQFAPVPNDFTHPESTGSDVLSDIERIAFFMRTLAPPAVSTSAPGGAASIANGQVLFSSVGCAWCHTPSLSTARSTIAALGGQTVPLYSDLLLHDMGAGLSDGVSQGQAGPREWRSAPLWGLGQRLFFLHDGRTSDLLVAIRAHQSQGSEANGVTARFNTLDETQKQDLLNFLRSR